MRSSWTTVRFGLLLAAVTLSAEVVASDAPIRQGPQVLRGGAINVGRLIPTFQWVDLAGQQGSLSDYADKKAIVVAMTGTGCPLCKKYAPTLADIERRYEKQDVAFLYINPNDSEDRSRLREEVTDKGFKGPYVRDDELEICRLLDVKTTTEVFVLDKARTLVYRGAVDDQYGFGYALESPRENYLTDALDAVIQGEAPAVTSTTSPGCDMFYPDGLQPMKSAKVTYHNRISRIIQRNCLECHRDDGVAPMPLATFDQVSDYAGMIKSVVQREIMPPWFAAESKDAADVAEAHSLWSNDRSLSDSEREDLLAWVAAGAAEGDPADAPLPRRFTEGWLIGKPDAVFEFPEPIQIKATGILPYKNIVVETGLREDKWVRSIEVVPGDRSVVHHVLVFVLPPADESNERRRGGGIDYWGIYVPGNSTQIYPEGYARRLPKNSRLKFQMHYTTNGSETEDRTKVGLIFADREPKYEVKTASIVNHRFRIPPGAPNHQVEASIDVPDDIEVLGYLPHHHLRGKACRYELTSPSGEKEVLLDIPRYDFNWQLFYQYAESRTIEAGSRINFKAWYDNSKDNPANPDPTTTVRWGEQTYDEMHIGYIEYVVLAESIRQGDAPPGNMFQRLDMNGDGELTKAEVRERMPSRVENALRIFDRLDKNKDGKLDRAEGASLIRER